MGDGVRAVPIDIGVQWETGAPMPQLLVGLRTFLLFYARPDEDGLGKAGLGFVEIVGCAAARFGPPNDEALENLPLWGHGLQFYAAHRVDGSSWLSEWSELAYRKDANNAALTSKLDHFIFTFHDETVEVLATELKVELFEGSMTEALQEASRRLATAVEPPDAR